MANVLPYAVDEESAFHASARSWLDSAINGIERVGLPWASLMAFQRIITHPHATVDPLYPVLVTASLAIEYGTGVCSYDSDFARFEGCAGADPHRLAAA